MEESKKKPLMIGIIVGCLVLAGVITIATRSTGPEGMSEEARKQEQWLICKNPACGAEYAITKGEYSDYQENYVKEHPGELLVPPMPCKECGKLSTVEAVKCAKCGLIFEKMMKTGDFADRCPKCGYSQTEENRKKAQEERRSKGG
jgi:predicted Zn-ribbon and HTH transcriptional regulator